MMNDYDGELIEECFIKGSKPNRKFGLLKSPFNCLGKIMVPSLGKFGTACLI
jgi:hypothetical protein